MYFINNHYIHLNSQNSIINLECITKVYNKQLVLDDISFALEKGTITTIIGQNGAGKSTLARIILGVEKPTAGKIHKNHELRIGYLPQKINLLPPFPITASDFLKTITNNTDLSALELINKKFCNFDDIKNKNIHELSGGELQKLTLLSILIDDPDLIILDEPTQYLDLHSQKELYPMLTDMKQKGITILLISHDLFTVMKNSDKVLCLNKKILCIGKPSNIEEDHHFQQSLSDIGFYYHQHK